MDDDQTKEQVTPPDQETLKPPVAENTVKREQDYHKRFWLTHDVTEKAVADQGFRGRAATMLELTLSASLRDSLATAILEGRELLINTDTEKTLISKNLQRGSSDASDCLWINRDAWADYLDFDYLNHTFTQNREQLVADAQVSFMLECFNFGAWGRTRGEKYTTTVRDDVQEQLQAVARHTIETSREGWAQIAQAAREFANSSLADEMNQIAETWNEKFFDPSSKSGSAVDNILETYAVMKNPDKVMAAAKAIYKEGMGLDLDVTKPKLVPSLYGNQFSSPQPST